MEKKKPGIIAAILAVFCVCLLTACTKDGNVVHVTDPADRASTAPLVTVVYDANALGDGNYNDLIYQGVEQAAFEHGLRTMQLSPATHEEGLAYLETLFRQMSHPQDTVRRLLIVASAGYDSFLRQHNSQLEANPYCDLLYLETTTPLSGKGSTLYLSYYGAMYEAGAIAPIVSPEVLLVAANPKLESITEAVNGFVAGFGSDHIQFPEEDDVSLQIVTKYLSDDVYGGFTVSDTTAMSIMKNQEWQTFSGLLVSICGGAATTFHRLIDVMGGCYYMGIDAAGIGVNSPYSAVKHVDRAVARCIARWLTPEGMPKHQVLGLADGYTEVVVHPSHSFHREAFKEMLTDDFRAVIHEEAIRKEAEYER